MKFLYPIDRIYSFQCLFLCKILGWILIFVVPWLSVTIIIQNKMKRYFPIVINIGNITGYSKLVSWSHENPYFRANILNKFMTKLILYQHSVILSIWSVILWGGILYWFWQRMLFFLHLILKTIHWYIFTHPR